jgi:hypothetical protein
LPKDESGAYFIDRCPLPFAEILAFVRSPTQYHPPVKNEDLMVATALEAEFLGIKSTIWAPSSYTCGGKDMAVLYGNDGKWKMHIDGTSHVIHMCKHGCGFGCMSGDPSLGVRNFSAGRAIVPAQPKMTVGQTCPQCNKVQ